MWALVLTTMDADTSDPSLSSPASISLASTGEPQRKLANASLELVNYTSDEGDNGHDVDRPQGMTPIDTAVVRITTALGRSLGGASFSTLALLCNTPWGSLGGYD